jgi:hypothetical protein
MPVLCLTPGTAAIDETCAALFVVGSHVWWPTLGDAQAAESRLESQLREAVQLQDAYDSKVGTWEQGGSKGNLVACKRGGSSGDGRLSVPAAGFFLCHVAMQCLYRDG